MTKEQRAEIFQFLYDLHQKWWNDMIETVKSGKSPSQINDLKEKVIPGKIIARCMGCESATDSGDGHAYCSDCFLKLRCPNIFSAWHSIYDTDLKHFSEFIINEMKSIRDCGWRDNGMSDEDLIGILIKLM